MKAILFPLLLIAPAALAQSATATLQTAEGMPAGTVTLTQAGDRVLIRAELQGLPEGWHGFHIHETGSCAPDFAAAGDHFNPSGHAHGLTNPEGAHAGDLPNIHVSAQGTAAAHYVTADVTLGDGAATIFDADGSAFIVHENPDSYGADAGAGGRIACGVIARE